MMNAPDEPPSAVVIRSDAALDQRLKPADLRVYLVIMARGAWYGAIEIASAELSSALGYSDARIRAAVRLLQRLNYLTAARAGPRAFRIQAITHPPPRRGRRGQTSQPQTPQTNELLR